MPVCMAPSSSKGGPPAINIPSRQRGSTRAQDTSRSQAQDQTATGYADWGFAPMTGFAPTKDEVDTGRSVLLPSQGGSWGFACESVVATPEPPEPEGVGSSQNSKKPRKKDDALQGGDENIPRSSQASAKCRTPSSMAIDCSPHGIEELRSRCGERPKSRVPSRGSALDLGECRPPTKQRDREKTPSGAAGMQPQHRKGESRRSRGSHGTKSRGASRASREPQSRGFGGFNRGFGGRANLRRGSMHGEGMTIKCDTYSRTGHVGGTMSYN